MIDSPTSPGTGPGTDSGTDLNARYGKPARSRRPLVIGGLGVLALTALVWLVWVAWIQSNPAVTSQLQGFEIVSPTSAKATIKVERSKSEEASCRVQAKAADFSIVGEVTVTVPADSARHQTLPVTLTTQRSATSVVLVGCTTPTQHRPR
ncbi:DUF4307 domain-containing protein [Kribbella solani]|uniref:DUF4307 domain-containing protein n=1 Tax=Kribbella solani TaxID=236067 RepID=UPI0029A4BDBC|nr:DUF4307 domain-containing protein [Kribbella solani]MDX2971365.1 DUF4307 domain-containing protein [Kribbella solani]MDX3004087.1 DUF4307 domain-containing protein [Kribbella solani]